jgi:hypothetical protein
MQRKTWYSILGVDAMPLSLKNLLLKGIQDNNSVAQFWLTNFWLILAADVSGISLKISYKKQWKISQSKICNTVLILDAL